MKRLCLLLCTLAVACLGARGLAETEITTVTFGHYEQDNDPDNGPEPIEWIVLTQTGNRALLLSRDCLDAQYFNETYADAPWEKCTLRQWLNDTFLNAAFTEEEQVRIVETTCTNTPLDGYPGFAGAVGMPTQDQLFLLSYKELTDFASVITVAEATGYAAAASEQATTWWLRSPGPDSHAALVLYKSGELNYWMSDLNRLGVRPAMCVMLED